METADALEALVAEEPPLIDPDRSPVHYDEYAALLGVELLRAGLNYCFPDEFHYEHSVELVRSETPEGDRLLRRLRVDGGMPQALIDVGFASVADFWAPWVVALHDGEIASIAISARLGPVGADVGITTMPEFRGRGLAAAAVAGWVSHASLTGLLLSYGTAKTNLSSQRVAARLGLRFLGATWWGI